MDLNSTLGQVEAVGNLLRLFVSHSFPWDQHLCSCNTAWHAMAISDYFTDMCLDFVPVWSCLCCFTSAKHLGEIVAFLKPHGINSEAGKKQLQVLTFATFCSLVTCRISWSKNGGGMSVHPGPVLLHLGMEVLV